MATKKNELNIKSFYELRKNLKSLEAIITEGQDRAYLEKIFPFPDNPLFWVLFSFPYE
jgi:hypothetical protein